MWDKIKGLIIEDEGKPSAGAAAPRVVTPLGGSTQAAAAVVDPSVGNEYVELLRKAILGRASALTSLLNAADKLATVIPDPTMRIKAAYQMVKSEGRGLNELLQAIEIHASDLASQERQFAAAAEQAFNTATGALDRELGALGPSSENARSQIESLQQQIANLNTVISNNTVRQTELTGKIAEEKAHFEANKVKFATALSAVQAELQSQKTVISSTLA